MCFQRAVFLAREASQYFKQILGAKASYNVRPIPKIWQIKCPCHDYLSNKVYNKFERLGGRCWKSLLSSLAQQPNHKKTIRAAQKQRCIFLEVSLRM